MDSRKDNRRRLQIDEVGEGGVECAGMVAARLMVPTSGTAVAWRAEPYKRLPVDTCMLHTGAHGYLTGRTRYGSITDNMLHRHRHTHQVVDVDEFLQGQEVIADALGLLQRHQATRQLDRARPV